MNKLLKTIKVEIERPIFMALSIFAFVGLLIVTPFPKTGSPVEDADVILSEDSSSEESSSEESSGAEVTLCHNQDNNPQTITISENALQAHLDHGDTLGECTTETTVEESTTDESTDESDESTDESSSDSEDIATDENTETTTETIQEESPHRGNSGGGDDDFDDDGIRDDVERNALKTDPRNPDTDGDGATDGEEFYTLGTDPLTAETVADTVSALLPAELPEEKLESDQESILSSESYICEDVFSDTHPHWAEDLICRMYKAGIVIGREPILFEPDDTITRAEWIKVLVRLAGLGENDARGKTEGFTDVTSKDWFYPYLVIAQDLDVARTEEGKNFHPNDPIIRGDAALYAVRMAGQTLWDWDEDDIPFKDLSKNAPFTYAILIANQTLVNVPNEGETPVIEGYEGDVFKPYKPIARSEAMTLGLRMYLAWFSEQNFEIHSSLLPE